MSPHSIDPTQLTQAELLSLYLSTKQELKDSKARMKSVWIVLAETNRRLQASTTAIKAAVSSLLNYDILWDSANQHEFLKTIDTSVDGAGKLVNLLTLALRLEAGSLELENEPQALQEIISSVQDHSRALYPDLDLQVRYPSDAEPVSVDYEYLSLALEYLFEIFQQMGFKKVDLQAYLEAGQWVLRITGLNTVLAQLIEEMASCHVSVESAGKVMASEHILRLNIFCNLVHLQHIHIELETDPNGQPSLCLIFPRVEAAPAITG